VTVRAGILRFGATTAGGERYGELVEALRSLTVAVVAANAPDGVVDDAIAEFRRLRSTLDPHRVTDDVMPAGHRWELPARGHPLLIPLEIDHLTETEMRGRTRFSVAHMGHAGLAHGGFISLVFDEVLGVFPLGSDPPARTVSLQVQYRAGTPIDTDLTVLSHLAQRDGRKFRVTGELRSGNLLLAEAQGLFVQPRT
jgi:acyl-coenzyme A thioesterase PaaI-like protein